MRRSLVFACLVVPLAALACGEPLTPAEKLDRVRATFTAELENFTIRETPVVADAAAEPAAAGEDEAAVAAEPVVEKEIILDILVSTDGPDTLPGITVDLTQVDKNKVEKAHRRIYVDVSDVQRGIPGQETVVLDDLDYEADDGFFVEVRAPIDESERGEYREFQSL